MKRVIRRIIRYANLLFALLLALSFLSPGISPQKVWLPSFLGLAYPYILAMNLAFMVFWIVMKKREFIISFLAILLGWHTLTRYVGLHPATMFRQSYFESLGPQERESEKLMKVMSFNVRAFDQYGWAKSPSTRKDIIQMLSAEDPDILCLQEFYVAEGGPYGSGDLFRALDRIPNRHLTYTIRRGRNQYGIAIFSQYPILAKGEVNINSTMSICSFADIRIRDDTVRVYNMHLQSTRLNSQHYRFLDSLKFRYDNQQMEEFRDISYRLRDAFITRAGQADRIADHIARCPYPLIICGDFNDTPVSYTYKRISKGLRDAFVECGLGIGRTYIGRFPSFRIDYIFYSSRIKARHYARKRVHLSDHFPIEAYLQLD